MGPGLGGDYTREPKDSTQGGGEFFVHRPAQGKRI